MRVFWILWHQGWNKLWKTGRVNNFGRKVPKKNFSCPLYSSLSPLIALFFPPVEAMHAVTVMSRNAYNICRHCVDQKTRFVSFHRISVGPYGVKPLKSGRSKTYSRPCIEIWRGHSPSLPYSLFHPCTAPSTKDDCTFLLQITQVKLDLRSVK